MDNNTERGQERRRFVRYKLKAKANVVFDDGIMEQGDVDDISNGGMFLNLNYKIPKSVCDKKVDASIKAFVSGEEVTIKAGCSIVRTNSEGVALFFDSIDGSNRQILRDLIGELNNLVRDNRK